MGNEWNSSIPWEVNLPDGNAFRDEGVVLDQIKLNQIKFYLKSAMYI